MFRRVNSSPVLFAQTLEIKNRQRFRRLKSITKKMSNLLSDRSVLTLRSSLELPVERVGEIFDVQNCHRVPPKLLHNGGLISDLSRPLLAPKTSASVRGHVVPVFQLLSVPATSESFWTEDYPAQLRLSQLFRNSRNGLRRRSRVQEISVWYAPVRGAGGRSIDFKSLSLARVPNKRVSSRGKSAGQLLCRIL